MEVKLIKQSYKEARESGLVNKLNLIGIISSSNTNIPFSAESIKNINKNLKQQAKEIGAEYIFGIEYKSMAGSNHGGTIGYGDSFKK